jgi:hypothetical protein
MAAAPAATAGQWLAAGLLVQLNKAPVSTSA